jgi:hypothetical protein
MAPDTSWSHLPGVTSEVAQLVAMLRWALVLWPVTGQLINHVVAVHLVVGQPQRGTGHSVT